MPRLLVVGSINMDLVARCPRAPERGETLHGSEFHTAPGGKGANQAVACARLGAETVMVGRVGEDAFGHVLRAGLAADGIDVTPVVTDPGVASGVALIVVEADGSNRIVIIGGANARLDDSDVARATALLEGCDAVLMQFEIPLPVVAAVAGAAREKGVRVVLDAGAATPAVVAAGLPALSDVLSPNESEAETLTGLPVTTFPEARLAADAVRGLGAKEVVMKLGARGALWVAPWGELHLPAFAITPIDTTAAGDAFTAALAVGLASGQTPEQTLARANAAGALACLRRGAQPSMPSAAEVDAFLRSQLTPQQQ